MAQEWRNDEKPMSKQSKQTKEKIARHTLRVDPDISAKATEMADEDLQSFPKFITKLVINEWKRRTEKRAA